MALALGAEKAHLDPRGSAKQQQTRGSPLVSPFGQGLQC